MGKTIEEVAEQLYLWLHASGSPNWGSKKVPDCGDSGRGKPTLQEPDGVEGGCPECGGTGMGRFHYNRKAPCDACQGTGKAQSKPETSKVSATAKVIVDITCPKCGDPIEIAIEGISSYRGE